MMPGPTVITLDLARHRLAQAASNGQHHQIFSILGVPNNQRGQAPIYTNIPIGPLNGGRPPIVVASEMQR